jgi:DNA modification methylase
MENVKVLGQDAGNMWHIYHGDCVEVARGLPENSVDFIIFSPPFESLYVFSNSNRDIGNCRTSMEFARHFRFLAKELYRTLTPGRCMSVHCIDLPLTKNRDGVIGLRDFSGALVRIFERAGFVMHTPRVTIRKDPVTAMQRTKAIGLLWKQVKKDSCLSRMAIPDYLLTFRKPGDNPKPVHHTSEEFPIKQWQQWAECVWHDINPSNTLQRESARDEEDERHIAPLQLQVIERAITMWTNPGDVVFTPFMGIGSEVYQAVKMGRHAIGIELKDSYYAQSVKNLQRAEAQQFSEQALFA